ncbi:MAG: AI-2E family transporter [Lachnospiraceae bacterium]|nr:AI-2E family transporter [Lachnospiraceae bacterium]
MKLRDPKYEKYWYAGVTAFIVIASALVIYLLFSNLDGVRSIFSAINSALRPIYIGLIIAYLLSPLVNKTDRYLFIPLIRKIMKKGKKEKVNGIARGCSVAVVLILALLVIFGLIMLVVPEIINSISNLIYKMPGYYGEIQAWGQRVFKSNPQFAEYFKTLSNALYKWLTNDLLPNSNKLLLALTDGVMDAVNGLVNTFIGIIISIYLMAGKENFCAQAKRMMFSIFPVRCVNGMLGVLKETHVVFAKFISGKIIDSLAVGILTFIIMSIAGIPYTILISVIIGVTNIIPFFGQYIGIVPSAFLVFLESPVKGVIFLVLIIVLMQFDGNVLGPKILGDSIGLKSFWILFSILFFGSLFGLLGMICAVPVFAIIYRLVKRWSTRRLAAKNIPTETSYYRDILELKEKD